MADSDDLISGLRRIVWESVSSASDVVDLRRLSGGASQETWALDAVTDGSRVPLILRRASGGRAGSGSGISLATEAALIGAAETHGVRAPKVYRVLREEDGLGTGFIMNRVEGETIARKILRDPEFDAVRPHLARQCGAEAARIHAIPLDAAPDLPHMGAAEQLDQYRSMYDHYDYPHPVFEYAFRWLSERVPDAAAPRCVHGDFRNGNFVIHPETGLAAVLDWELAHTGDPMEDLGWICVNSWRFGNIDQPVGGFGLYDDLFAGYEEASGAAVDRERVKYWETFGTLKWGIMCMTMYFVFNSGLDRSVERAAIGRRSSETEIDLLRLIVPRPAGV